MHNVPLGCNPKLLLLYYVRVLCQNGIYIDTVCVDVRYLCEKWLCKKRGFWCKFQNVRFKVLIVMSEDWSLLGCYALSAC